VPARRPGHRRVRRAARQGRRSFDDFDTFVGLIVQHGGTDLGREDVLTATEQYMQRAAASDAAAEATRALAAAMGGYRGTVLKWAGCTRKQFDSALQSRLNG
jgi:hypothetical protein